MLPCSPAQMADAHGQADGLNYAVRGGKVVYSAIGLAFEHYERVRLTYGSAELMGTHNYFKAVFFASGLNERDAEKSSLIHAKPRSVSAHSAQSSPVGRDPVTPTPLPRDAAKPGPSSSGARPTAVKLSATEKQQASAARLQAIQGSLQGQSKVSPTEKKQASLARLVAIQGSLLQRTQQQQQQKKVDAVQQKAAMPAKQEKQVAVKQEMPGTSGKVLGKGKAKAETGYESDDFYTDDDDDFAHLVESWASNIDTYIHEGQPRYKERFDPRFENQPGDNL
ncbi:hypothetical protein B0H13DRAFT_2359455 [Mycena leptocephala]|nr:hypothetical protein B0H13DRAFT_2359455 [Mycena leptocephala]